MITKAQEQVFTEIEGRLAAKFSAIPSHQVTTMVDYTRNMFSDSMIRDFIPLLVERRAARELSALTAAAVV